MRKRPAPWIALVFPILATAAAAQDTGSAQGGNEAAPSHRLTFKGGVLPSAIHFDSVTSLGARTLRPGPMGLGRVELAFEMDDSLFVQACLEFAEGKEVRGLAAELDLGIHLLSTELGSCRFDLDAEAGLLLSKVWVTTPGFGSFDLGWGLRAGLDAHLWLSRCLSLDASVDIRVVSYPWSGSVTSGDQSAQTLNAGLLLGLSLHF